MDHHAGKLSIVRLCIRAETETAALKRKIHTGDKMNLLEDLFPAVYGDLHITGRIGKKQTDRCKCIDQISQTEIVQIRERDTWKQISAS